MVSAFTAQRYFKTFFAVMPERLKFIGELKGRKAEIDKKVISGGDYLSPDEISQLIDIIGKDILFRKAEKRKKYTLRHMNWKLLKSVKYFGEFYFKIFDENYDKVRKLRKITGPEIYNIQLGEDVLELRSFFEWVLPRIKTSLEKKDSIYKRESNILEAMLNQTVNIKFYKKLLEEEKAIDEGIIYLLLEIKKRNVISNNILKSYYKFLRFKGALTKEIGMVVLMVLFGFVGIRLLMISYYFLTGERSIAELAVGSDEGMAAAVGILGISTLFGTGLILLTQSRFIEFFKFFLKK